MNVTMPDKRIGNDDFLKLRQEVLATWPTGAEVDLQEAIGYQRGCRRRSGSRRRCARRPSAGRLLLQPRAGVALLAEHIKLLKYLETEGEADLLPTTIDAYTRQNRYAGGGQGDREVAGRRGVDAQRFSGGQLRGEELPPGHRVRWAGRSRSATARPTPGCWPRSPWPADSPASRAAASPTTSPTPRMCPLRKSLSDWQYVDRLCGLYEERA